MINVKEIASKIEAQRRLVVSRIGRLRREDPFSTEDRAIIVEPGTDAAILSGHERTVIMEDRLKRDLREIEAALKKIKKGTYGKCERCGKSIDVKRLEVKPQALYCLKCESEIENKKR
ncbi:MAG: DnaK suppressor protein [Candidatus Curtissbacteria bacterium GW2011_GWA1_40_9]|uniref:DnaK suppressor protein n=1 Tax=Candidatus Curtissbacteria bacterium GW2011_GWA1_40_9 TaxID=1618408 RepID=A0A0G0W1S3_9BACT|nr:MAG: DnaK suppressor protein [Candidatus Curtissbacteria bacterium GW2011_GWA1_40_9]